MFVLSTHPPGEGDGGVGEEARRRLGGDLRLGGALLRCGPLPEPPGSKAPL